MISADKIKCEAKTKPADNITADSAVRALEEPSMAVSIRAGEYMLRGTVIHIAGDTELSVDLPDKIIVASEEHVLSDEKPEAYVIGTMLKRTIGTIDTNLRMPEAIIPDSVVVHSEKVGGSVYVEGTDYFLDRYYGGISRLETGSISKDQTVYVDYAVFLQRIDLVQVDAEGVACIKKGESAAACPDFPSPCDGYSPIAYIYLPFRMDSITDSDIYQQPESDLTWRDFIRVSGREYLRNTSERLKTGKSVSIVCWGDSVTEGCSPSTHEKCYVELFRAGLQARYPQADIKVINAGIGGTHASARLGEFDEEVLAYDPDLITVEYVNDVAQERETTLSSWIEFIRRARAKNPAVEIIILTPAYMRPDWMGQFDAFVGMLSKLAIEQKVALGDTANIWANLRTMGIPYEPLLANIINHPNDLGHEFFAETLFSLFD